MGEGLEREEAGEAGLPSSLAPSREKEQGQGAWSLAGAGQSPAFLFFKAAG